MAALIIGDHHTTNTFGASEATDLDRSTRIRAPLSDPCHRFSRAIWLNAN